MFSEKIAQKSFVKNDIIFTTPLVKNNYDDILKLTESLPYKIYGFRFINPLSKPNNKFDNNRIFVHKKYKQQFFGVFKIMASEKYDIYNYIFIITTLVILNIMILHISHHMFLVLK